MTNREEVAARLRETGKDNNDWSMGVNAAFFKIDDIIGAQYKSYGFFFSRLADLIDPTCEVVEVPDNDEFMVRVVSGFMCKKCGHESIVERNCDGWAEPPNYCPHCGARVVRDD